MTNQTSGTGSRSIHKGAPVKSRPALIGDWVPELQLDGGTKYAAVAAAIEEGIKDGHLTAGMRLPPQRDLANYFNVTIATVTKAISVATRRGLVHARAGSGTFISADPQASPITQEAEAASGQDLSLNAPPLAVVTAILQENFTELAHERQASAIFDYEPIPGSLTHRLAGCRWMALRGLDTQASNVLVSQGAHEGLLVSLAALTTPGDVVLCERLNYTGLRRIVVLKITLIGVEVDQDGLCVDHFTCTYQATRP